MGLYLSGNVPQVLQLYTASQSGLYLCNCHERESYREILFSTVLALHSSWLSGKVQSHNFFFFHGAWLLWWMPIWNLWNGFSHRSMSGDRARVIALLWLQHDAPEKQNERERGRDWERKTERVPQCYWFILISSSLKRVSLQNKYIILCLIFHLDLNDSCWRETGAEK